MSRRLAQSIGLAALLAGLNPALVFAQGEAPVKDQGTAAEARALAQRIDRIIYDRLRQEKIKPGAMAGPSQLARRLHIDLAGRIPTLLQIRDYLENDSPNKWEERVDELLASPNFVNTFTHYYRSIMLTGTNNNQAQAFQFQFEGWLRGRLTSNAGFDKITHEVITSQPFNQGGFSPSAFFVANENKAENLAGATARIFMGVKIECAQCHKHPFAKWTRQQFWEFAAFFSELQPGNRGPKGQQTGNALVRSIKIPESDKVAEPRFITGDEPTWKDGVPSRNVLADWVTSAKNPFFAKASVDHVWQYFFGVSLTEPILEPTDESPPAHPELLDELAQAFVASGYDIKFLVRAIVQTEAYRRVSVAMREDTREDILYFAKMPIRGMMPEQLFDSFAEATDYRQDNSYSDQVRVNFGVPDTPRQQFLAKFTSQDKRIETQTSILQALYVMNGKFLAERVKLDNNEALKTVATAPTTTARRVETLYMMVLSRLPRAEETEKMVRYIESGGGTDDSRQAVADVYWALLNSSEFMLNH